MTIEKLKELYINQSQDADIKTKIWSEDLFGVNINGDTFWSIGITFIYELIKLLGTTNNYDKFNLEGIESYKRFVDSYNLKLEQQQASMMLATPEEIVSANNAKSQKF